MGSPEGDRDGNDNASPFGSDDVYMLRNQIAKLVVARSLQRQEEELLRLQVEVSPRIPPRTIPSFVLCPPLVVFAFLPLTTDCASAWSWLCVCVCLSVCCVRTAAFGDAQRIEAQHPKWLGVCIPGRRQSRRRRRRRKCRLRLARYPTTLGSDTFFQTSSVFGGRAGGGKSDAGKSAPKSSATALWHQRERDTGTRRGHRSIREEQRRQRERDRRELVQI